MRLAIFLKKLFGYEQSESHLEHVALWVNSLGGIQHLLQKMMNITLPTLFLHGKAITRHSALMRLRSLSL